LREGPCVAVVSFACSRQIRRPDRQLRQLCALPHASWQMQSSCLCSCNTAMISFGCWIQKVPANIRC
jgi:hypothetical protein